MPSSAARAAIASILQAPSSSEYSLWACRWTAEGELTIGGRSCQSLQMERRVFGRLPRNFRGYSGGLRSREGFRLTFSVKSDWLTPLGIGEKVQDAPPLPGSQLSRRPRHLAQNQPKFPQ